MNGFAAPGQFAALGIALMGNQLGRMAEQSEHAKITNEALHFLRIYLTDSGQSWC
jgi:hypothetical protein